MTHLSCFLVLLMILLGANCDFRGITRYSDTVLLRKYAILFADSSQIELHQDGVTITSVTIQDDLLKLMVSYGGGCKPHDFQLFAWKGIAKSNPPQAELLLSHDAHNDFCEAYLTRELEFDLVPLKLYLRRNFNLSGTVVLRIYPPGATEPFEPRPVYRL
jgi:hypothetical protein